MLTGYRNDGLPGRFIISRIIGNNVIGTLQTQISPPRLATFEIEGNVLRGQGWVFKR